MRSLIGVNALVKAQRAAVKAGTGMLYYPRLKAGVGARRPTHEQEDRK